MRNEAWRNLFHTDDGVTSLRYSNVPDIAVVGMACRFPGADNYRQFWDNLVKGVSSISEMPEDRWNIGKYFDDSDASEKNDKIRWAGVLGNVAKFDAEFFGISPQEAQRMDPQQRMMLELAWHCIEDAGYHPEDLSGENVGVFIGVSANEYEELQKRYDLEIDEDTVPGVYRCMIPNRISYFYNLHGPSVTVDTACSSSLVSIHQAVHAIRTGECEAAFAGGVSILATPTRFNSLGKRQLLSPSGQCKSFDASADGYVRSEGAGILFLKPLDKALAGGDNIWGVIRGTAVNHGGRARSLTMPGALAQSRVITSALRNAVVSPSTITYIESHGDGSPLGDSIEVHGLIRAYNHVARREGKVLENQYCAIGAVKTNIGHTEAAAGIASVIKVLLAFKYETLPSNLNFSRINSRIKLGETPFYLLNERKPWQRKTAVDGSATPLRAGVSAFGLGGVNSHLILEEAPQGSHSGKTGIVAKAEAPPGYILLLSVHKRASLQRLAMGYADLLRERPERVGEICKAMSSRSSLAYSVPLVFKTAEEGIGQLERLANDEQFAESMLKSDYRMENTVIGFLFTGEGANYSGMAMELFRSQPIFRRAMEHCDRILRQHLPNSLLDVIFSGDAEMLNEPRYEQVATLAVEFATTELLRSYGITPAFVMGYGVGEIVAACVAGVFSIEDALFITARRGELMMKLAVNGAMSTVYTAKDALESILEAHAVKVDIAAINGEEITVITGEKNEVDKAVRLLNANGVKAKRDRASQAYHSRYMTLIEPKLSEALRDIPLAPPRVSVVSCVTGLPVHDELTSSDYWIEQAGKPVFFNAALETMIKRGVNVLLETGPTPLLTGFARKSNIDNVLLLHAFKENESDYVNLLTILAGLYSHGVSVEFDMLYDNQPGNKLRFPPYPFGGEDFWLSEKEKNNHPSDIHERKSEDVHRLLGRRLPLASSCIEYFSTTLDPSCNGFLPTSKPQDVPVIPVSVFVEIAFAAANTHANTSSVMIDGLTLHSQFLQHGEVTLQTKMCWSDDEQHRFEVWASENISDAEPAWVQLASGSVSTEMVNQNDDGVETRTDAYTIEPEQWSVSVAENGLAYGTALDGIESFTFNGKEGFAEVNLPHIDQEGEEYLCHPEVLNVVFQSSLALLPPDAFHEGLPPVPVSIEKLWLHCPLPSRLFVSIQLMDTDSEKECYRCDFRLQSTAGEVIGEISGFTYEGAARAGRGTVCA